MLKVKLELQLNITARKTLGELTESCMSRKCSELLKRLLANFSLTSL